MLGQLRQEALQLLADISHCMLSTSGPAGIQASVVPCQLQTDYLYLLVPDTSEHIFNLEHDSEVVVTAERWQLRGEANLCESTYSPFSTEQTSWHVTIEIRPKRMQINSGILESQAVTVDFP